jgi:hypothetical protein
MSWGQGEEFRSGAAAAPVFGGGGGDGTQVSLATVGGRVRFGPGVSMFDGGREVKSAVSDDGEVDEQSGPKWMPILKLVAGEVNWRGNICVITSACRANSW